MRGAARPQEASPAPADLQRRDRDVPGRGVRRRQRRQDRGGLRSVRADGVQLLPDQGVDVLRSRMSPTPRHCRGRPASRGRAARRGHRECPLRRRPAGSVAGHGRSHALRLFRRFCEVADSSPALRAAPYVELERFTAIVGAALAERIGGDPDDPEVTLAAIVIAGLARVWARATFPHVQRASSMAALERAVRADVERALRIAAPTLDAFDNLDA